MRDTLALAPPSDLGRQRYFGPSPKRTYTRYSKTTLRPRKGGSQREVRIRSQPTRELSPLSGLATFQKAPDAMIRHMAKPEFLQRLGVFILRDFLDPDRCAQICTGMKTASHEKATVGHQETAKGTGIVDETVRKVLHSELPEDTEAFVCSRLDELKPQLEKHFRTELTGYSGPHFLLYQSGGFYTPHTDRSAGAPPNIAARRVSVVIFLNTV